MKAYVITSGTIFGLLTLAHLLRIFAEGMHLVRDPVYVLITALAAALCLWALRNPISSLRGTAARASKSAKAACGAAA